MAPRQPLNDEQRRLMRITGRMPLASVGNLASVLGLDEEKVRRMLARLRSGGWVSSVMRGMTEDGSTAFSSPARRWTCSTSQTTSTQPQGGGPRHQPSRLSP